MTIPLVVDQSFEFVNLGFEIDIAKSIAKGFGPISRT